MSTLSVIILATLASGALSMVLAGLIAYTMLGKVVERMVSFAIGVLLAAALLHLIPEATQSQADVYDLFAVLLGGIFLFFMLQKTMLLRHSHHHEHDGHHHDHGFNAREAGPGGYLILIGDGLHNFCDGILIAAAFLIDWKLGMLTALSIAAHEIPQEIGDFMILLSNGFSKTRAFMFNMLVSLMSVAGGVLGYFLLDTAQEALPYVIMLAASSFIYIAMSDLIPFVNRSSRERSYFADVALMGLGVAFIVGAHMLVPHSH
ncbi:ZIP family metal transporter [Piscinibacterium candidicorallinum]|uniref:ZIP family metal transporter n=1 Tax=Piscinibacterium candidicorallinum TaxID=1793872 RepID=A0ABV7H1D8_9BURK